MMKKLVIDRSKWARGGEGGDAALLNRRGNMCCLGFACIAAGFNWDEIFVADPASLPLNPTDLDNFWVSRLVLYDNDEFGDILNHTDLASEAIDINDNINLPEETREAKLIQLFKNRDIELEFIN